MSLPVVFRDEAQDEFDDAFDWYEEQRPGLGVAFVEQVQTALVGIASLPQRYPTVRRDIRRAALRRFPYCVYYRAEASQVVVLAIFHDRRDPRLWLSRT